MAHMSNAMQRRCRWVMLLLLAVLSGCSAKAAGRPQARTEDARVTLPSGGLVYFRTLPRGPNDLWLQSLDGKRHQPLTSSGRVTMLPAVGAMPGPWGGAAISPEGRRVAYAEFQGGETPAPSKSRGPVGGWTALFVVNADGTARREVVDLRRQSLPEGQVRAGSFIWSDDGRSLVYVLETLATKDNGWNCSHVTLQSVEVESGRVTRLSEAHPLGHVTLLGWAVARGEVSLYGECARLSEEDGANSAPIPEGRFIVLRPADGTLRQQSALAPSLSPRGTHVFIPSRPRTNAAPSLYRLDALSPARALPLELPAGYEARLTWLHHSPIAFVSATQRQLPPGECAGVQPRQRLLYRLETETGQLHRVRDEASGLNIVAVGPDDRYVLVGLLTGEFSMTVPCGRVPLEALYLVPRHDLESELSLDALRRRAIPLTPPRPWSSSGTFPEYVGWVR